MELNLVQKIIKIAPELYPIFKGCPYEILKHWQIRKYRAGTVICRQGDMIDCLYIVIEGYAEIYFMAENGSKYSQAMIQKGQFIGEFEIFDQRPIICSAAALTDLKLLQIQYTSFIEWLKMDNNICIALIQYLCTRAYYFSQKAGNDTLYSLKARLCSYLLSRCQLMQKQADGITLQLDKDKLSEQFAVTVRSINRVLQSLRSKNIIEIETDSIMIKDLKMLAQEEKRSRHE
jgi:CRP-like cAMP-binding protein